MDTPKNTTPTTDRHSRKSVLSDSGDVFDVGAAYSSGATSGTIVSDKKRKGVFGLLKNAAGEISQNATKAVKDVKIFEKPTVPKVTPGTERKEIIQKAISVSKQAPKDDYDVITERIRTFQKDAERISGKPYLITRNPSDTKPSWGHVIEDGETPPKEEESPKDRPLITREPQAQKRIVRSPEPRTERTAARIQREEAPVPPAPASQPPIPPTSTAPAPQPVPKTPASQKEAVQEKKGSSSLLRYVGMGGVGLVVLTVLVGGGMFTYDFVTTRSTDIDTPPTSTPRTLEEGYVLVDELSSLPSYFETQSASLSTFTVIAKTGDDAPVETTSFFEFVAPNAPTSLVRALDQSMLLGGVRTTKTSPYLVFKTTNFDTAFAGMLSWEPMLTTDLRALFNISGSGKFLDRVIENQHVRILHDSSGAERMVYGFVNGRILIITETSSAYKEILRAL